MRSVVYETHSLNFASAWLPPWIPLVAFALSSLATWHRTHLSPSQSRAFARSVPGFSFFIQNCA